MPVAIEPRIVCTECDASFPLFGELGIEQAKTEGWRNVFEDPDDGTVLHWWTHLGYCPECIAERPDLIASNDDG